MVWILEEICGKLHWMTPHFFQFPSTKIKCNCNTGAVMKRRSTHRHQTPAPQPLKRSRRLQEKRAALERFWAEAGFRSTPSAEPALASGLTRPLHVTNLPPEVLLEIFSWLSIDEIEATASRVCSQWRRLAQSSCLRKSLSFRGPVISTESAVRFLRSSPQLESLELIERLDVADLLKEVPTHNRKLRRLVVKRCHSKPGKPLVHAKLLQNIVHRCLCITDITVKDTQFRTSKFYRDLGVYLPKLRRVNFNYNAQFGSIALNALLERCEGLEEVRTYRSFAFKSSMSHCTDDDVVLLSERMHDTLTVLKLNATLLTDRSLAALGDCHKLRTLHLPYAANVSDAGIDDLAKLRKMVSLSLSTMRLVSRIAWIRMFQDGDWLKLRSLALSICLNVDDEVLYAIAEACPNLERLNLSGCVHVSEDGVGRILTLCHKLRDLNVYFTQVYVVRSFNLIPLHAPNLKRLVFRPLGFDEELQALDRLKEALPKLKILHNEESKRDTYWGSVNFNQ